MTTEMFSYFERVVVWLTTGKLRARVEADSGTSAFVQLIDADGKDIVKLDERHLRDMLAAMKQARAAARAASNAYPMLRRDED